MLPHRGASYLLQKKCYAGWNMGLRGHTDTGYYLGCRWLMKLDPCQKVDVAQFIVCILFSFHQLIIFDQSEDFRIEKLTIVVIKSCLRFHKPHSMLGRWLKSGEWCAIVRVMLKFLQQMLWRDWGSILSPTDWKACFEPVMNWFYILGRKS